jgi:protein-L-isoaspartate O-methyltransferase
MELLDDIDVLEREFDTLVAHVTRDCAEIATELARPLPCDSARIIACQRRITGYVRDVSALLPKLNIAESRLAAEARARAEAEGGRPLLPPRWYTLRMRADRLRSDMNQWHEIQALIAQQAPPIPQPLYWASDGRPAAAVTQADVSDTLFNSLHKLLNPQSQDAAAYDHGCYPDIGLSNSVFLEHAHAAYRAFLAQRRRHGARFLDVGCGAGLKVVSAVEFFERADGIEFDVGYADTAKALFDAMGLGQCHVMQADALTFEAYGDYDVIYFYRPMRDEAAMRALEARIVEQARPGTLLIAAYGGFAARHADLGCGRLDGHVYVAGANEAQANELRNAAEHIGVSVRRRETKLQGLWEPLLAASHANGYGIRRVTPIRV